MIAVEGLRFKAMRRSTLLFPLKESNRQVCATKLHLYFLVMNVMVLANKYFVKRLGMQQKTENTQHKMHTNHGAKSFVLVLS